MVDFTNDERFDGLYINVAQTAQGIEPLLDTVFSFLRRKTDFFNGPPGTSGATTDPTAGTKIAVQTVHSVLNKHVEIYTRQQKELKAKEEAKKKKKEEAKRKLEEKRKAKLAAEKKKEEEAEKKKAEVEQEDVIEIGNDGFDISNASDVVADDDVTTTTTTTSTKDGTSTKSNKPPAQDTTTKTDTSTATKTPTDETNTKNNNEDENDNEQEDNEPAPVDNGGTVPGKYTWAQTLQEVSVTIPIPPNTRGKDLNVSLTKKHLKVGLKSQSPTLLIDAPFYKTIIVDDSFWTLEDASRIVISLSKLNQMEWWDCVCKGDPTINIQKIQPENSKLGELDGETRQTVEKMMFDQRQKQMGLPTSDEQHKFDMLEKFKKAHPEMDFSNVKMS